VSLNDVFIQATSLDDIEQAVLEAKVGESRDLGRGL
jgi:hypothetical protein